MTRPKLKYIGKQMDIDGTGFQMWNIINSPMPWLHPDNSTISLESLREMGIIR